MPLHDQMGFIMIVLRSHHVCHGFYYGFYVFMSGALDQMNFRKWNNQVLSESERALTVTVTVLRSVSGAT